MQNNQEDLISLKAHICLKNTFSGDPNYLLPKEGIDWKLLAALLTSSIFALSLESAGSTSLGAGALELPTTKLSKIMVPDIRKCDSTDIDQIISAANEIWSYEQPYNWKNDSLELAGRYNKLDTIFLHSFGIKIDTEELYSGIRQTINSRLILASEKNKARKNSLATDINSIASAIVNSFDPQINSYRFPESFIPDNVDTVPISFDPNVKLIVSAKPFLTETDIEISSSEGHILFESSVTKSVGEVLVRSLLIGRRTFVIPKREETAQLILDEFWTWLPPIFQSILDECSSSSLGTRFEQEIRLSTLTLLNWSDNLIQKNLYGRFILNPIDVKSSYK